MSNETEGSDRPYTVGSFQAKLNQFQELMKEITLQDVEATPEEKRQMITGMMSGSLNSSLAQSVTRYEILAHIL